MSTAGKAMVRSDLLDKLIAQRDILQAMMHRVSHTMNLEIEALDRKIDSLQQEIAEEEEEEEENR